MESVGVVDGGSGPVTAFTGDEAVTRKRCKCCELEWPETRAYFPYSRPCTHKDGKPRSGRLLSNCRACTTGGARVFTAVRRGELDKGEAATNAIEFFARRNLGLPTRNIAQTDVSVEVYKRGGDPGRDLRALVPPVPKSTVIVITESDHKVVVTNDGETPGGDKVRRQSRGARTREQKQQLRDERLAAQARAHAALDPAQLEVEDNDELVNGFLRDMRSAKARSDGKSWEQKGERTNPWRRVHLSKADTKLLLAKAIADGYRFYKRPKGWVGSWPFKQSPDKIDPAGDYVRENLRMVPWIENRARGADPIPLFVRWLQDRGAIPARSIDDIDDPVELRRIGVKVRDKLKRIKAGVDGALDLFAASDESPTDVVSTTGGKICA